MRVRDVMSLVYLPYPHALFGLYLLSLGLSLAQPVREQVSLARGKFLWAWRAKFSLALMANNSQLTLFKYTSIFRWIYSNIATLCLEYISQLISIRGELIRKWVDPVQNDYAAQIGTKRARTAMCATCERHNLLVLVVVYKPFRVWLEKPRRWMYKQLLDIDYAFH